MSYLNSVTIIGFVGADPEQRQARNNNGSKFTVLSVATQRSWKNTDDEWASKTEWHRVCVFRPRLAEYVATTIKKGSHVLVEGSLVSDVRLGRRMSPMSQAAQRTWRHQPSPAPAGSIKVQSLVPKVAGCKEKQVYPQQAGKNPSSYWRIPDSPGKTNITVEFVWVRELYCCG